MIRMRHLQPTIIGFELPRDQPPASFRQQALEIGRIGIEIDELERARCILHQHTIGATGVTARTALPMLGHGHFQRGKLADPGIGDPRR